MTLFMMIVLCLVIFLIICLIDNYNELHSFQTIHYSIKSDKLRSDHAISMVFISDLHNHQYGEGNEELLAKIKACNPDLILIGGDMIVRSDETSYVKTFPLISRLTKLAPVYFANGNHEQKLKEFSEEYSLSYTDLHSYLNQEGVVHLINETVTLKIGEDVLSITGLEIPVSSYRYFGNGTLTKSDLEDCIGVLQEPENFHILLAHNPMFMKEYKSWGADLILSGHLHGGIVRIPFLGGLIAPNFTPFPKYSGGFFQENKQTIIVSNGLGTHSVPIRINCPAQLIHLTIHH